MTSVSDPDVTSSRPPRPVDPTTWDLDTVTEQVLHAWREDHGFSPATMDKCGEMLIRFCRRLAAQGVSHPSKITPEHCTGFVHARTSQGQPPEVTTLHARRSTLRMYFRTLRLLGVEVTDPTIDIDLPPRTGTAARPLTDVEVALCRAASRMGDAGGGSLHRAVCWALGETTAVSSEISAIRVGDVDDSRAPRWVHLPGTRRHDPRLGELSDWGSLIVARQMELLSSRHLSPSTPLVYKGQGVPGEPTAQSAVCNALAGVLRLAGLAAEPDVRPASLRNWAGRRLFTEGMPIELVARRMGARSLDTVAVDIDLNWRDAS